MKLSERAGNLKLALSLETLCGLGRPSRREIVHSLASASVYRCCSLAERGQGSGTIVQVLAPTKYSRSANPDKSP